MKICFLDLQDKKRGVANRDQTGGYGSTMNADGFVGKILSKIKGNSIKLPVLSMAYMNAIAKSYNHETLISHKRINHEVDFLIIISSITHHDIEINAGEEYKRKFPNAKIIFTGPFAHSVPEIFFESFATECIIGGDVETGFKKILDDGIKRFKGKIINENLKSFDNLPMPDWSDFNHQEFSYWPALPKKPFFTIQASRGCPFACEFCPYLIQQGIPLRRRSNKLIIDELKYLKNTYNAKSILFRDITWSFNKKLTKELCKEIINSNLGLEIGVETRLDCLDDELIDLMEKAGVRSVNLGIESPDDEILIKNGRIPYTKKVSNVQKSIQKIENSGIKVQAFYILGLQDDNKYTMRKTLNFSKLLNTFTAQFCVLTPFPGTPTYNQLKEKLLTNDFTKFDEYTPVVKIDGASEKEIIRLRDEAFSSYYFRLSWLKKHISSIIKSRLNFVSIT
jgi:anaerobic magnesium-protoporphyrin IX monomethyl ester cyclase